MFADSLIESSWANRLHRGWTTLVSFAVQAVLVGSLLLIPLFYTSGLPRPQWMAALVAPARANVPIPAARHTDAVSNGGIASRGITIVAPPSIPTGVRAARMQFRRRLLTSATRLDSGIAPAQVFSTRSAAARVWHLLLRRRWFRCRASPT